MRRQGQYHDPTINPTIASQMQQMPAHSFQQHSGNSHFSGQDSARNAEGQQHLSLKADRQRQWDTKGLSQQLSYAYTEGEGANASRPSYEDERSGPKLGLEKQTNKDSRAQSHQEDTGTRYGDSGILQTFEDLDQKFSHDITSLLNEQQDAEDAETARHREKLGEINARYQEKLLALRARQTAYREEFLRKESQARHQQHQQAGMRSFRSSSGHMEVHGFAPAPAAASAYGDARQAYSPFQSESYGERPEFVGGGGGDRGGDRGDAQPRGPYPGGRAYNSGGRDF